MSNPEPKIVRIMDALCEALGVIAVANGFYNDVIGIGIEPLSFDATETYPKIVVHEESGQISDSNAAGYTDSAILAAVGFVKVDPASAYRTAYRLRDDMTRVMRSITAETFKEPTEALPEVGYINPQKQMVTTWLVDEKREIVPSEVAQGFLEVIVRASVVYRDFSPPVPGI